MGLSADVEDVFGPGGLLEQRLQAEHRPEQQQMAMAVARAFERKGVLLAEAGTGTGKTFAYCVPALLSGQRVVISTATKNLQDQIAQRDLPRLIEALGVKAQVQVLKGRGNYLCWQRLPKFRGPAETFEEIKAWAHDTPSGDRAELHILPDDYPPWRDIDARSDTCLGHGCPHYGECFVTKARAKAAVSDIVVVNHHLFFADLALRQRPHVDSGILPAYDAVIFDEAHAIEDVVTEHFGASFSDSRLRDLLADVVEALSDKAELDRLKGQLSELPLMLARVFSMLDAPRGGVPGSRVPMRNTRDLPELLTEVRTISNALERLAEILLDVGKGAIWEALADRARRLAYNLGFVFAPDDDTPQYARIIEERPHKTQLSRTVRALPLDVAGILEQSLFADPPTTVLTSATLSMAGDFSLTRSRIGIATAEELIVESPFAYTKNALLFVPPASFPEPNAPIYPEAVSEALTTLVTHARGGALLLFTSLAAMNKQAELLTERFEAAGCLVLRQGDAPKHSLLQRFAHHGAAVLFGSQSFFEGVDVPGQALRLVVVDKLPFASPSDPLLAARIAEAEKRGERTFDTYQLAGAVLSLRQAFGRLIRTKTDRGVVAVLDARLRTRGYGRKFLQALPPAQLVADAEQVAKFFSSG